MKTMVLDIGGTATVLQHHMFACSLKAFYLAADRLFLFLKLIIFH